MKKRKYGLSLSKNNIGGNSLVLWLGVGLVTFHFYGRLRVRKHDGDNTTLFEDRLHNPVWDLSLVCFVEP